MAARVEARARRDGRRAPGVARRRAPPRSGTYSTCLAWMCSRTTSPRDLADEEVVRRHLAADDGEPEAPARVDRDHARVAADRVAREHHAGHRGVDHQLHGDPHRGLVAAPAPSRSAIADRRRAVEADPAVAHRVADVVDAAHPQIRLLLAGERRVLAVLADRARAHRDRRLGHGLRPRELLVRRATSAQTDVRHAAQSASPR